MEYSKYQTAIFDWVRNPNEHNSQVIAPAGSGKTFTGVQSVKYIPKGMKPPDVVYLAFNKHIQVELETKLPEWAKAQTYHAFGLTAIRNVIKNPKIDGYKNYDILKAYYGNDKKALFPIINRLVGLFKGNLESYSATTLLAYIDYYGIDIGDEGYGDFDVIERGTELLLDPGHVDRLGKIDFDDMIWYPIIKNLPLPSYDWILVDEAQDTNAAQTELVIRSINGSGRVMTIGDPRQAIYGWRGAGIDSMDILKNRLSATELPLSITYRCPRKVVELVNQEFPDIPFELWDGAAEGEINTYDKTKAHQKYTPGDMVLCRLNAPLVPPAMALLKERKKAIIKGKDIGKNLLDMVAKIERKFYPQDMTEFLDDMDTFVYQESERYAKREQHGLVQLLEDKRDTLLAFAENCDNVPEMKSIIEQIFDEKTEGVTFSSVHRAKGLEADNVFILHPELMPFKRAKTDWQKQQEENLRYVSITRCRKTLNFVVE